MARVGETCGPSGTSRCHSVGLGFVFGFALLEAGLQVAPYRHRNAPDCGSIREMPRVRFWLQADIQSPEIEVRSTPSSRHSRQGWECLKLTHFRHRTSLRQIRRTHAVDVVLGARNAHHLSAHSPQRSKSRAPPASCARTRALRRARRRPRAHALQSGLAPGVRNRTRRSPGMKKRWSCSSPAAIWHSMQNSTRPAFSPFVVPNRLPSGMIVV